MSDHHLHLHPHAGPDVPPASDDIDHRALIDAYVEAADRRGISELGFTEHLYRFVESGPVLGRFWEDDAHPELAEHTAAFVADDRTLGLERYVEVVSDARDRGLPVRLGLEIDFFPETIDAVMELIEPYPWDFLIGSVHWLGPWAIDSGDVAWEFERRGVDRAWEEYFDLTTALAASGTVDVLAHVDVCKKYGFRPEREPVDLYAEVVAAAVESGTAVEVSSQGLRKPAEEEYPSPRLLEMFCDAGVPITLASDAHVPDEVGFAHDHLVTAARSAGYETRLAFDRRRRSSHPL